MTVTVAKATKVRLRGRAKAGCREVSGSQGISRAFHGGLRGFRGVKVGFRVLSGGVRGFQDVSGVLLAFHEVSGALQGIPGDSRRVSASLMDFSGDLWSALGDLRGFPGDVRGILRSLPGRSVIT